MKALYVSPRPPSELQRLARRPIGTIMSTPVVTISVHASMDDALAKLIVNGLRHLVAVHPDGRCAGVLPDRAVAAAWAGDFTALTRRTVAGALDLKPAVVPATATVTTAARLMRDRAVDAVAVVDTDGRPLGIVTGSDLIAMLAA